MRGLHNIEGDVGQIQLCSCSIVSSEAEATGGVLYRLIAMPVVCLHTLPSAWPDLQVSLVLVSCLISVGCLF